MEIRTERLLLRRPRSDDLDAMFAITSDPRAMRYWSTLPHADRAVTRTWLDQMIERNGRGGEDFVIELDGSAIGIVGAGLPPHFGFLIAPEFWGRGLGYEASAAFVRYAFSNTSIVELQADVDPRNAASLALLNRLGFVETRRAENTFLLGDEWCHSIYLALQRPVLTGATS